MRSSPKAAPIPATANSGDEMPLVRPSRPSTAVSKDKLDKAKLQKMDKPHPKYPVWTGEDKQETSPPVTTTRYGRIVQPPTLSEKVKWL